MRCITNHTLCIEVSSNASATFAYCVQCMQDTVVNKNAYVKAASTVSQPAASFERYLYIVTIVQHHVSMRSALKGLKVDR